MTRILSYDAWVPAEEGLREALCALGNGVFVTRGAAAWAQADEVHYPGTYLAGGYSLSLIHISSAWTSNGRSSPR